MPLTSEILVSNRKLQPCTAILFGFWHVFSLSVHENSSCFGKPDKEFACQLIILWMVDKEKACQCSFSIHWEEKSLSARLYGYSDKLFACQLMILWLVDKQKACQCSFRHHWEEKILSVNYLAFTEKIKSCQCMQISKCITIYIWYQDK